MREETEIPAAPMLDDEQVPVSQRPTCAMSGATEPVTPLSHQAPGVAIGPYRLVRKVGEGGMGEVWQAEQERPVRRTVALKLIKQGMDTRQVVARFESERQALAVMDHPCIARVFDAGATERGLPYFVMEFVEGEPITSYCDRLRLGTRARLRLFSQVCVGVQHAHQKAIIHRDLKPSNILVTTQDGVAVPKIIDFGLARATNPQLNEVGTFTHFGQIVGTPEYMSPEQTELTSRDIDTRTDVYSLGVILYELLVGVRPFESTDLRGGGIVGLIRTIQETEPVRPSVRVLSLRKRAADTARSRSAEWATLARDLRGDLDWIIMKAMEKDRARRYGSPSDMAQDIGRFLRHEPVLARPPSTGYKARKFVRRHSAGVTVAAVLLVLLVGFAVSMTVQAGRIARALEWARREAEASSQVSGFLVSLFKVSDPSEARGSTITAREILDKGSGDIRKTLQDQPEVQARLMTTMGEVYRNLGLYSPSEALLKDSLEIRRQILGEGHPETLKVMRELGILYYYLGRYDECERLFRESLEGRRRALGPDDPATLESMNGLANLYNRLGQYAKAEPLYLEAVAVQRRVLGNDHADTLKTLNNLSSLYRVTGRNAEAEPLALEALEARRRLLGPDHPNTLSALQNLASIYGAIGQYDKAEPLFVEALETRRRVLGDDHPETLLQMNNLGDMYTRAGRYEEAEPLLVKALDLQMGKLGADHPDTFLIQDSLADLYMAEKKYLLAEPLYVAAFEGRRRRLGETHADTLHLLADLIALYTIKGEADKARDLTLGLIAARRQLADAAADDPAAKDALARLLLTCQFADLRDPATALIYSLRANQLTEMGKPEFLETLALAYRFDGKSDKAIEILRRALSLLPSGPSPLRARLETALGEQDRN